MTNIEFKNQSINSSLKDLSHGEEFIQNDVLKVLNNPQNVSNNILINIQLYPFIYRKKIQQMKIKAMIQWKIHFIVEEVKILCLNLII